MSAKALKRPERSVLVPLTRFHNQTGEYLDLGLKAPVTITKHGRPHVIVADAAYFSRLETMARGKVIEALGLTAVLALDMPEKHHSAFEAATPSEREISNDRWDDDNH